MTREEEEKQLTQQIIESLNRIYPIFTPTKEQKRQYIPMEYKGYTILAATTNKPGRDIDNIFVIRTEDTAYIVGLDDSKMNGYRVSLPNSLEDAINYIDWITRDKEQEQTIQKALKETTEALKDIINASDNKKPYTGEELIEIFNPIFNNASQVYHKATGELI
jgi:hypothetical protein